jgi:hypothetical protein
MRIDMYVHTYTCLCVHILVCCERPRMHAHIVFHAYGCWFMCMCTHVMPIHTHTHTYIHMAWWSQADVFKFVMAANAAPTFAVCGGSVGDRRGNEVPILKGANSLCQKSILEVWGVEFVYVCVHYIYVCVCSCIFCGKYNHWATRARYQRLRVTVWLSGYILQQYVHYIYVCVYIYIYIYTHYSHMCVRVYMYMWLIQHVLRRAGSSRELRAKALGEETSTAQRLAGAIFDWCKGLASVR